MDPLNEQTPNHQVLLEWETPEFVSIPRGRRWYLVAGLALTALVTYALWNGSWTMAIFFLLASILFLFAEKKQPKNLPMVITDLGIFYGKHFYSYHEVSSFWMVYHPPYVRSLYLKVREGRRNKRLKIELDHQAPQPVRALLLKEVPEFEGAQEPFSDLLIRLLRLQ